MEAGHTEQGACNMRITAPSIQVGPQVAFLQTENGGPQKLISVEAAMCVCQAGLGEIMFPHLPQESGGNLFLWA